MKEISNYSKIEEIYNANGGFIKRKDADMARIASWFFYDFIKKNQLVKIAPGAYSKSTYFVDEYFVIQKRYPKYIFSGFSALYLNGLTDNIPTQMDVTAPQGYHPSREKCNVLRINYISNSDIYKLGIKRGKSMFGNWIYYYDEERTICELIKHRCRYDSETFVKAIKNYARTINNQTKLFKYARALGIEKKVFDIMEIAADKKIDKIN